MQRAFEIYRDTYDRGAPAHWFWVEVATHAGLPTPDGSTIRSLIELEQQRWSNPSAATLDALGRCTAAGHELAILSNAPHELADSLEKEEWSRVFKHVMTSARLKSAKPDPEVWQLAIGRLGTEPANITFFDDRESNVAAATASGINALVWTGLGNLHDLLDRCRRAPRHARPRGQGFDPTPVSATRRS